MLIKYIERLFEEPLGSYLLFGPRGTGKSTMVAERHPNAFLIDLRLASERFRFLSRPDSFKTLVEAV
jgi:uncharacterized protein